MPGLRPLRRLLAALATMMCSMCAAELGWAQVQVDPPYCTAYVSATRRGQTFGPFMVVEPARFPMPGATQCNKVWTVEEGAFCGGIGDTSISSAAHVEESLDGVGCDIVVSEFRMVITPFDLEHDPRVRRMPGSGGAPDPRP